MDKKVFKKNIWKFFGYGFFAALVAAILCVRFLIGSVIAVSGTSMVPTFQDTDYVFATIVHDDDELKVGDIVILEEDGVYLIKRIAGIPGDTLEADYTKGIPNITLGQDEYYVLGDNWRVSRDSRMFGPISRDRIEFKYADVHWTRMGMIISLLIPAILFIAQLSIVFIPADKKKGVTTDSTDNIVQESDMQDAGYNEDVTLAAVDSTETGSAPLAETHDDGTELPSEPNIYDTPVQSDTAIVH
jgi:signal peptidase I